MLAFCEDGELRSANDRRVKGGEDIRSDKMSSDRGGVRGDGGEIWPIEEDGAMKFYRLNILDGEMLSSSGLAE